MNRYAPPLTDEMQRRVEKRSKLDEWIREAGPKALVEIVHELEGLCTVLSEKSRRESPVASRAWFENAKVFREALDKLQY